jgi:hypothetical protein
MGDELGGESQRRPVPGQDGEASGRQLGCDGDGGEHADGDAGFDAALDGSPLVNSSAIAARAPALLSARSKTRR